MRLPIALFAVVAAGIAAFWFWMGLAQPIPGATLAAGEKLACVSYAPFRTNQSPLESSLGASAPIETFQIDEDLARLSKMTGCVRTYSTDFGLDKVPEIARKYGLKVIQGLWLSSQPALNKIQVEAAIDLAHRFPDVITAIVVGNEVLLRRDLAPDVLIATIRDVKARAGVPVTYADVWEFWLRHQEIASVVDFVTVHILPYWEDFPIPAATAVAHIDSIHQKVVEAFPGKDILIGETGWPSAGRMREGALPSPVNQARVIEGAIAAATRGHYRVNVIEAFDQPWKRQLEGTVGGHWGIFDAVSREPKFAWGAPVSDHPNWLFQALFGIGLAAAMFAGGAMRVRAGEVLPAPVWYGIAKMALVSGALMGWAAEKAMVESFGTAGAIRSGFLLLVGLGFPLAASFGVARRIAAPRLSEILGDWTDRPNDALGRILGIGIVLLCAVAIYEAVGLVFDPRYRDFAFASLTSAVTAALVLGWLVPPVRPASGAVEVAAATVLGLSVVYIVFNEGFANWQALWVCAAFAGLILALLRARAVRG